MTTEPSFGERMRDARKAANLSLIEATYALRSVLPSPLWCSVETIRRMERPDYDPAKAEPLLVMALADVYKIDLAELSIEVYEVVKTLRDLLALKVRCSTVLPGQLALAA